MAIYVPREVGILFLHFHIHPDRSDKLRAVSCPFRFTLLLVLWTLSILVGECYVHKQIIPLFIELINWENVHKLLISTRHCLHVPHRCLVAINRMAHVHQINIPCYR